MVTLGIPQSIRFIRAVEHVTDVRAVLQVPCDRCH